MFLGDLRPPTTRLLLSALLFVAVIAPRSASAGGEADEAELHFQLAADRYRAKDYLGALEHFLISNRLVPNRNVTYNIARTFEQLERFPDAHRYYVDALEGETDPKTRGAIEDALARLSPKVAVLRVTTVPPGATIYVDRKDLGSRGSSPRPLALAEGRYRVLVELDGYEAASSAEVEVKSGKAADVKLELERIVGKLRVLGPAGAAVRVDDEQRAAACESPCALDLPPGVHVLYLSRPGFEPVSRSLLIRSRETSTVAADLVALTGGIVVTTEERDALVEIDGKSVGFTPVVARGIPIGLRRVRVSLRGHRPHEQEVEIRANEQVELSNLRLSPIREITAASRYAESIEDAPSSVSIISSEELRAFAYPTIAEALRGTRGVVLSHDGAYSAIAVRGLGQPNDYGNRLLVLADGTPLNDNILNSSYIGYDGRSDLADVERIEIVRGAGSVLYGTGAVSGVVNLVTRGEPEEEGVSFSAGSADGFVTRARIGASADLGALGAAWASVSGAHSAGRAMSFDVADESGASSLRTIDKVDSFTSGSAALRSFHGPLTLQGFFSSRDQVFPLGGYGTVLGDPGSYFKDTRAFGEARWEAPVSDTVEVLARLFAHAYAYKGRYEYGDFAQKETYDGGWLGGEVRLTFEPTKGLRLSAGGELQRHALAKMNGVSIEADTEETVLDEDRPYTIGAAYGLADVRFGDAFRVSAGARVDAYSTFGASINPRVAVIVKPTDADTIKLSAGRAFRAPSIYEEWYNDGGLSQIAGSSGEEPLRPESAFTGDLELWHRMSEDWVVVVAGHAGYLEDIIETHGEGTMESPLQYVNSDVPVLTSGADVELRREWRTGWMFAASYGYLNARYTERPDGVPSDADLRIQNAPEHSASVRGVVPLVPELASLATRATFEAPRKLGIHSDERSKGGVVADAVLTGRVHRYGVHYALGIYNLFDWVHTVPVIESWPARAFPQQGRRLLVEIGVDL